MAKFRSRPTARAQQLRNNATDAERHLWRYLSHRQLEGFKFSRQIPVGPFICDFVCRERKLIIELDGGQHANSERDKSRTAFLEAEGFRVIRFWNNDVLDNVEGVLFGISQTLRIDPPLDPLPQAGGETKTALS